MRLRHVTAVTLLAAAVAAAPGQAAAPQAAGAAFETAAGRRPLAGAEPGFWGRLVGPDGRADAARAWRESARAVATAAHPFARIEADAGEKTTTLVDIGQAGDLDGDGGADVALFRLTYRIGPVWVLDHADVETRSGRTGRKLWAKRVTLPRPTCEFDHCGYMFSFGYAFATPVGGAAGIEVVMFGQLADHNRVQDPVTGFPVVVPGSYINTFDAIALDRHGRQKWARRLEGRIRLLDRAERIEHLPVVHDVSAGLEPGADLDWLYDTTDGLLKKASKTTMVPGQPVEVPAVDLTKTQTYALNGRTGTDRAVGPARDGEYGARDQTLVRDLSGDGRDDVVVTPPWSMPEPRSGTMSALRSTDGATIWQRATGPANLTLVEDVGDYTGDRRGDLVVIPVLFESATAPFTLVNGANGHTLWSRSASSAAPIPGRRPLVAFGASQRTGARKAVVTVAVYDARNRAKHTRRFTVTGTNAEHTEGAAFGGLGDVDGDGTDDFTVYARLRFTTKTKNTTTTRTTYQPLGSVSGASGRALPVFDDQTYPLYDSVDGHGDDVETDGRTGARIRDGRTGRTLLVVDLGQPVRAILIGTQRADRDRCVDVFVVAYLERSASTVYGIVSGANGRALWQATDGERTTARIHTSDRRYRCR